MAPNQLAAVRCDTQLRCIVEDGWSWFRFQPFRPPKFDRPWRRCDGRWRGSELGSSRFPWWYWFWFCWSEPNLGGGRASQDASSATKALRLFIFHLFVE